MGCNKEAGAALVYRMRVTTVTKMNIKWLACMDGRRTMTMAKDKNDDSIVDSKFISQITHLNQIKINTYLVKFN